MKKFNLNIEVSYEKFINEVEIFKVSTTIGSQQVIGESSYDLILAFNKFLMNLDRFLKEE